VTTTPKTTTTTTTTNNNNNNNNNNNRQAENKALRWTRQAHATGNKIFNSLDTNKRQNEFLK
jgi:hypothetical protein